MKNSNDTSWDRTNISELGDEKKFVHCCRWKCPKSTLSPADRDISFPRTSGNSLSTHTSPHHKGPICLKTVLLPTAAKTSNLTSGSSAMKGRLVGVHTERIGIARLEVLKAVLLKIEDFCQVTLHRCMKSSRRFERS